MSRQTLTTTEAAWLLEVDPRSFRRWAHRHGTEPVRRVRIGRSWTTVWALTDITALSARMAVSGVST
jgi:hypothetical protein